MGQMRATDAVRIGTSGLRARPVRAALSALGIAIGIATVVAVVSIPASSKAGLLAQLGRLGDVLTVDAGQSLGGSAASLPRTAAGMIRRVPPVNSAAATGIVSTTVRRSPAIPAVDTGGMSVVATDTNLLGTLDGNVQHGVFLNAATTRYPAVVLGRAAAQTLGISNLASPARVDIGGVAFRVVGILDGMPLSPEIDESALIGFPAAATYLGFDGTPTRIYVRTNPDQVVAVQHVLAATANPESPEAVRVSRPSDAITARAATKGSLNGLLLALGAVALLVGGIGIANVMIIAVLERRSEIGLRRALGASRPQIGHQFLIESLALSAAGGLLGLALGTLGTISYAHATGIAPLVPLGACAAALGAALAVGALAGLAPAFRAARIAPTVALRAG